MLKFTLLPSALASVIYPINLRLKMPCMIPVSPEVNLRGSFSRLKACYRIDCRNAPFRKSLYFFPPFFKIQFSF